MSYAFESKNQSRWIEAFYPQKEEISGEKSRIFFEQFTAFTVLGFIYFYIFLHY